MKDVLRGPERRHRIVKINLVLVLVFVVVAVLELTRTWLSATHIAENLHVAGQQGRAIAQNTQQVQRLDRTATLTSDIVRQTEPLPGQVDAINRKVGEIDGHARHIAGTAGEINHGVRQISVSAGHINQTVGGLLATVGGIGQQAGAINANARGIEHSFARLDPVARQILDGPMPFGVRNIDRNVNTVISQSHGLRGDLANILSTVHKVDNHAESICKALIISVAGGC